MQVSHVNDHVTHAVIGGGQTIDFGISNSPEFFNILSSTLYKDQILAVVRETLCNAWDAHIEAGKTATPIQITLNTTDGKFVIKDFGKGIHHDDIGLVYGTYGNSTKKNDGTQTGGFGLGCKAPFAYTDHFEVISCHEGVRTIYNLSKSSAQTMGKPGIVPIASFPCGEETGLTVSIPFKNDDVHKFKSTIKRIIYAGDMNATFNGHKQIMIDFDQTKSNYYLFQSHDLLPDSRVMIRYGNVIYPVEESAEIAFTMNSVLKFLSQLGGSRYSTKYRIIFQAPPNSISVTPSRESLSMQKHTVDTLNAIFKDFNKLINTKFVEDCEVLTRNIIDKAIKDTDISGLLSREYRLPSTSDLAENTSKITDTMLMAKQYLIYNYPETWEFRKKDIGRRIKAMSDAKLIDRGLAQTYLKDLIQVKDDDQSTDWLMRRVIAPLMAKLQSAKMDHHKLYVYDREDCAARTSRRYAPVSEVVVNASKSIQRHLFKSIPFLRNIVVLVKTFTQYDDRVRHHPVFKLMGEREGVLVYRTGMKKVDQETAREFFKKTNMTVVDMIDPQPWEVSTTQVKRTEPRKPPKKGVVLLKSLRYKGAFSTTYISDDNNERTETPECIIKVSTAINERQNIGYIWTTSVRDTVIDLFGDKCGVVNLQPHYEKWVAKGIPTLDTYVVNKVLEYMTNNQHLISRAKNNFDTVIESVITEVEYPNLRQTLRFIYNEPELLIAFNGTVNPLSPLDHKYLSLWFHISESRYTAGIPEVVAMRKRVINVPPDITMISLAKDLATKEALNYINMGQLIRDIRYSESPESKKKLIDLFLKLIK